MTAPAGRGQEKGFMYVKNPPLSAKGSGIQTQDNKQTNKHCPNGNKSGSQNLSRASPH